MTDIKCGSHFLFKRNADLDRSRQAWRTIIGEEDALWIDANIARAEREPNEPFAGVGLALKKLRARGAGDDEIIDLVRGMQVELLFSLCYLLEDPGELGPEVAHISWILAQIDEEDQCNRLDQQPARVGNSSLGK